MLSSALQTRQAEWRTEYAFVQCSWDGCFLNVLTDADGFFEVELNAESDPRLAGAFGYIHTAFAGYQGDVQILPTGATPITKNLRMSPVRKDRCRRIDHGFACSGQPALLAQRRGPV
jgi:hypothetical protein